jgi:hypothetical protein
MISAAMADLSTKFEIDNTAANVICKEVPITLKVTEWHQ